LPDVVLLTGDLADGGAPEPYVELRRRLAPLPMALYLMPGNHDDRSALREAFPEADYLRQDPDFLHFDVDLGRLRLIALDSLVPGQVHGALCPRRLEWLAQRLEEQKDKPVVLAIHHPPFKTGIARMDAYGMLEGAEDFAEIVARHPRVERLLCGHLHRAIQVRWAGDAAAGGSVLRRRSRAAAGRGPTPARRVGRPGSWSRRPRGGPRRPPAPPPPPCPCPGGVRIVRTAAPGGTPFSGRPGGV